MNLQLYITTQTFTRASVPREKFVFVIVDLDRAENYPANFVCLLPQTFSSKNKNTFYTTFGEQSLQVAKKLLTDTLENENNPAIREQIRKRLTALEPKPVLIAKCKRCGEDFEPKTFMGHQQQICQICKNKT